MKKLWIICLIFSLFWNIDFVSAEDDPCGCNRYEQGTAAHFHCLENCQVDDSNTETNTYSKIVCNGVSIPYVAAQITSIVIDILKIATPLIIVIFGMIDLTKSVIASKEDDVKKGWHTFIKRLIAGACVFLAFFAVEIIIGLVAPRGENQNMWSCVDCFVNGNCSNIMR